MEEAEMLIMRLAWSRAAGPSVSLSRKCSVPCSGSVSIPQVVLGSYQCNFPSITGKQYEVRSAISDQFS